MVTIAAIILAAGRGTRFGREPKMLAAFEGKPLVTRVAEAALESEAEPVIVVVGHEAQAVSAALAGLRVTIVENAHYREGLSTSLKAGFAALPEEAEAAAILLGDMPQIGTALLDWLLKAWRSSGFPSALVPTFQGRRGHPAILSKDLAPAIARLTGDTGAGKLLRPLADVVEIERGDPAVSRDADTPQELAALAAQASTIPVRTAE
ncbi:MAG TPA: nucleotidyltransferase family protein [Enterovirga sp.]|nr:nucleotidyltransferase family protein [Enterovirga sp.]